MLAAPFFDDDGRPVRGTGGTQVAERSQDGKGRKIEEEIFFANKSTSDGLEGSC